jgi:hypothetical protein
MNKKAKSANEPLVKSDLEKLDAHVIAPDEYKDLPEWTEDMFAEADHYRAGQLVRRGRPKSASTEHGR